MNICLNSLLCNCIWLFQDKHWQPLEEQSSKVISGALYIFTCSAYNDYKNITPEDECLTFENWTSLMEEERPQFSYWYKTLQLELLYLRFLHSQGEQNYTDYVISLIAIIPGMFVFDQFHDPRWMYVHVSDPLLLKTKNKSVQSMINSPFIKKNV